MEAPGVSSERRASDEPQRTDYMPVGEAARHYVILQPAREYKGVFLDAAC